MALHKHAAGFRSYSEGRIASFSVSAGSKYTNYRRRYEVAASSVDPRLPAERSGRKTLNKHAVLA